MCRWEKERHTLRRVRLVIDCDLGMSVDRKLAGALSSQRQMISCKALIEDYCPKLAILLWVGIAIFARKDEDAE